MEPDLLQRQKAGKVWRRPRGRLEAFPVRGRQGMGMGCEAGWWALVVAPRPVRRAVSGHGTCCAALQAQVWERVCVQDSGCVTRVRSGNRQSVQRAPSFPRLAPVNRGGSGSWEAAEGPGRRGTAASLTGHPRRLEHGAHVLRLQEALQVLWLVLEGRERSEQRPSSCVCAGEVGTGVDEPLLQAEQGLEAALDGQPLGAEASGRGWGGPHGEAPPSPAILRPGPLHGSVTSRCQDNLGRPFKNRLLQPVPLEVEDMHAFIKINH